VNLPVTCGGMLVVAAALTPAIIGASPLALVAMLCVTTAARSVLWTVSYSLAASAGQRATAPVGASQSDTAPVGASQSDTAPVGARQSDTAPVGASQGNSGLGASIGLLNVIWAATAVLGPLGAGLAAGRLGAGAAFGLTQVACVAALAVTVAMMWRGRRPRIGARPEELSLATQQPARHG
jgi:hypothetical protein